nr:MAG TPA: hypothetical protein [Bacteriophage sp.]
MLIYPHLPIYFGAKNLVNIRFIIVCHFYTISSALIAGIIN